MGVGHDAQFSNYFWDRDMWELAVMLHSRPDQGTSKSRRFERHKEVFIGHTTTMNWKVKPFLPESIHQKVGEKITVPMLRCNVWNLDTGGGFEGKLSVMDIDTKEFWQSDFVKELYQKIEGGNMSGRHTDMGVHIGKTYSFLTVLDVEKIKGKYQNNTWFLCECCCGKRKLITSANVLSGATKSCGCKRKELTNIAIQKYYKKAYITPVEDRLFSSYKRDTKKHSRDFELSKKYFREVVNKDCFYCGTEPFLLRGNKTRSVEKALNGVDRVDSSKGYVLGNVVPCCHYCNRAKNTLSTEDFKVWVEKLYLNLFK